LTKNGCAGKYTNCFEEDTDFIFAEDEFDIEIISSKEGGGCVAMLRGADRILAKTMFCDQKLTLGCQSSKKTHASPIDQVKTN